MGIAGSSMGALVGGLEAAGKLDEYAVWASSLTQRAVLRPRNRHIKANAGTHQVLDASLPILWPRTAQYFLT